MLAALKLANQILSLAPEAIALLKGIINQVRGVDARTQRAILDKAFAAAEEEAARRIAGRQ